MFTMTYNQAMLIQRAQMAYYRRSIGRYGVKSIRQRTLPCPGDPNEKRPVIEINRLVPRGGDFEGYIRHRPSEYDPTQLAMHEAIKRGLQ